MDFWTLITLLGGVVLLTVIALKYSGASEWVLSFIQHAFNLARQVGQSVFDHLPKPIRVMLVVIVLGLVLQTAYNYTVGVQYVCLNDQVMEFPWLDGFAMKFYPPSEALQQTSNEKEEDTVITEKVTNVTIGEISEILYDGDVTDISGLDSNTNITNGIFGPALLEKNHQWGKYTFDKVAYFLVPTGDIKNRFILNEVYVLDQYDIFDKWLGIGSSTVTYSVCLDDASSTCVLQRDGCDVLAQLGKGRWDNPVATLQYSLLNNALSYDTRTGDVSLIKSSDRIFSITFSAETSGLLGWKSLFGTRFFDECTTAPTGGILDDLVAEDPVYNRIFANEPINVKFDSVEYRGILGTSRNTWTKPLYGVQYALLMKGNLISTGEQIDFVNKSYQPEQLTVNREKTASTISDLFVDAKPYVQNPGDATQITCNKDTEDAYDTTLTFLGIKILDKTILVIFMLLGLVLTFYSWVHRTF